MADKMNNRARTRTWMVLGLLAVAAATAAGIAGYAVIGQLIGRDGAAPGMGEALVGGPFELIDGDGRTRTDQEFRGRHMLIYFGFTYCPDVCPTELQNMTNALDQLGDAAAAIQPIFISIDPERDTPEVVGAYVDHFHPSMIGLTGSPEAVAAAAKAYRVYYRRADDPNASDYLMDHSSIVYLMRPDGKFLTHFSYGTTAEEMAATIRRYL